MAKSTINIWRTAAAYIFICFALCFLFFPTTMDDYWLLGDFKKGFDSDPGGSYIAGFESFWKARVEGDTARLSNFACLPFLLLPRWVPALLSFSALVVSWLLMGRLGGLRKDSVGGWTLLLLAVTLGLPWHDSLFTGAYSANYLWETPLMLGIIILFFREKPTPVAMSFLLGLLLGCWHEIFGVPVLCGAGFVMLFRFTRWRTDRVLLCLGILCGLTLLALAPCMRFRFGNETGHQLSVVNFVQLVYHLCGFWLFVALWIICLLRKRWRGIATNPFVIFVLVACASVITVQFLVLKARAGFPAYVIAYVGIVFILGKIAPVAIQGAKRGYMWLCWAVMILLGMHMTMSVIAIYDMAKEREAIETVYLENTTRPITIFADLKFDKDQSILTLKKAFYEKHSHGWHFKCFHKWAGVPFHFVIPKELKSFEGNGEHIPGNADAVMYKGFIVMPFHPNLDAASDIPQMIPVVVDYGGGPRHADLGLFRGADGKYYYFVNPYSRTWEFWSEPKSVEISALMR